MKPIEHRQINGMMDRFNDPINGLIDGIIIFQLMTHIYIKFQIYREVQGRS